MSGDERPAEASSLLQAFVAYLRARPPDVDAALEGIASRPSNLGGIPAVTLEPFVGSTERPVVYYHGGGYVSGSPPDRYLPLAGAVALAAEARGQVPAYRLGPPPRLS